MDWDHVVHVLKKPHELGWVIFDQCEDELHKPTPSLGTSDRAAWPKLPRCVFARGKKVLPKYFAANAPANWLGRVLRGVDRKNKY